MMKRTVTAAAAAVVLAWVLTGCGSGDEPAAVKQASESPASSTPSPTGPEKDATYSSVTELKDAAVAAGYQCTNWVQDNKVNLAAESGHCSDEDLLSTFATEADLQSQLETSKSMDELLKDNGIATTPTLIGPNWMIHGLGVAALADQLGGTVYSPE